MASKEYYNAYDKYIRGHAGPHWDRYVGVDSRKRLKKDNPGMEQAAHDYAVSLSGDKSMDGLSQAERGRIDNRQAATDAINDMYGIGDNSSGVHLDWYTGDENEDDESRDNRQRDDDPDTEHDRNDDSGTESSPESETADTASTNNNSGDGTDPYNDLGNNYDPAAHERYNDKNSLMDSAEEAELGGAESSGASAAADAASAGEAVAEAAEATAAAAEATAAAAEAGAVVAESAAVLSIGWPAAIVIFIIAFIAFMFLLQTISAANPGATVDNKSNCASTAEISGPGTDANGNSGYYQLPESEYYTRQSSSQDQWGNKDTIELIMNVGKIWSESHADQRFSVGDVNSSGHLSHKTGVDVDIYNDNNSLFKLNPNKSENTKYDKNLTIELGKIFLNTNVIEYIFYDDPDVIKELNKYATDNKLKGVVKPWDDNHWNHFHVRVIKGAYQCTETSSDSPLNAPVDGVLDVPYQNQFTDANGKPWKHSKNSQGSQAACGITSVTMVINYFTNEGITVDEVWKENGGLSVNWAYLNKKIASKNVAYSQTWINNVTEAEAALKKAEKAISKGYPAILRVYPPFAASVHIMVLTGFDGDGNVYINDPNNGRGKPPYLKTGSPKGKNNLADRTALKKAMVNRPFHYIKVN